VQLYVAQLVAKQEKLDPGFRVAINDGPEGCQVGEGGWAEEVGWGER